MADPVSAEMREKVGKIKWYHTIDLGHGIVTSGLVDTRPLVSVCGLPDDLSGKRVLDAGTSDGFWAFEMERRGAAEVVALDVANLSDYDVPRIKRKLLLEQGSRWLDSINLQAPGEGFKLASSILGSRVRRELVSIYDLSPETVGMFDLTFVGYLLVHLRDPMTALENLFSVTRETAIIMEPLARGLEDPSRPLSSFIGTSVGGMWWEHNSAAWRAMAETAGFDPVEEVARKKVEFRFSPDLSVNPNTLVLRGHVHGNHD